MLDEETDPLTEVRVSVQVSIDDEEEGTTELLFEAVTGPAVGVDVVELVYGGPVELVRGRELDPVPNEDVALRLLLKEAVMGLPDVEDVELLNGAEGDDERDPEGADPVAGGDP